MWETKAIYHGCPIDTDSASRFSRFASTLLGLRSIKIRILDLHALRGPASVSKKIIAILDCRRKMNTEQKSNLLLHIQLYKVQNSTERKKTSLYSVPSFYRSLRTAHYTNCRSVISTTNFIHHLSIENNASVERSFFGNRIINALN